MRKSFTLIEILIVIVVIGILSAFILVGMSSITNKATIAKGQAFTDSLRNSLLVNIISEWKLDEGSGTTITDSWSGGNNGTLTCAISSCWKTETDCVNGTCCFFSGDSYVSIDYNDNFNFGTNSFTVNYWFAKDDKNQAYNLNFGPGIGSNNISFDFDDGSYGVWVYWMSSGDAGHSVKTTNNYSNSRWHNLTFLRASNIFKLYVDSVYITQTTESDPIDVSDPVYSSLEIGSTDETYVGKIDEVVIYNAAMSTSQINQIYYSGLNNLMAKGSIDKEEYNNRLMAIK